MHHAIGSGVFACPGGVAEDEFNLSAMPSRNGRYLRAPRKGGAFHWVRAPPGARSIRKGSGANWVNAA